jgi:hypothetical protein
MCQTSNTISGKSLQHAELQTKNAKSKSKWKLSSFDNVGSKYTDKHLVYLFLKEAFFF